MPEDLLSKRKLEVRLNRVTFRNESTNWTIAKCEVSDHEDKSKVGNDLTCVGNLYPVTVGMYYEVSGKPVKHKDFGWQLKVDDWKPTQDMNEVALKNFLVSFAPGIGDKKADQLIDSFGRKVLDIMIKKPRMLLTIDMSNITIEKVHALQSWAKDVKVDFDFRKQLYAINLTSYQVARIFGYFNSEEDRETDKRGVFKKLKDRCFELVEVHGFGFKIVCAIADKVGIPRTDKKRTQAGILYSFKTCVEALGHSYIGEEQLILESCKLLEISKENVAEELDVLIDTDMLCTDETKEEDLVAHFLCWAGEESEGEGNED